MECDAVRQLLTAYGDNELSIESALAVEHHLQGCSRCRELLEQQRRFAETIGHLYPHAPLPADVEARVQRILYAPAVNGARYWVTTLALAASALLAIAGLWTLLRPGAPPPPAAVVAAARVHRSALTQAAALAVRSSDPATVNGWLRTALPFLTGEPVQARTAGLALEGAGALELAGERVGYVQYRRGADVVSLFLLRPRTWPTAAERLQVAGMDFQLYTVDGLKLIAWNHPPLSYVLVSELGARGTQACAVCHSGPDDAALRSLGDDGLI